MSAALDECDRESLVEDWGERAEEIPELRKFFRVCVERGLGLAGSW